MAVKSDLPSIPHRGFHDVLPLVFAHAVDQYQRGADYMNTAEYKGEYSRGFIAYVPSLRAPPTITSQPVNAQVNLNDPVAFSITAGGTGPFSYQWRKGGVPISGNSSATSATLVILRVQLSDAGNYDVVVTNAFGSVPSAPASLTVSDPVSECQTQVASLTSQVQALTQDKARLTADNDQLRTQLAAAQTQYDALLAAKRASDQLADLLRARNAELLAHESQGMAGLDELLRLLQAPPGRRQSDAVFTGPIGDKVNAAIKELLARPPAFGN